MNRRKVFKFKLPSRTLVLGQRTLLMGVLNVTPDSFSDGGKFFSLSKTVETTAAKEKISASLSDALDGRGVAFTVGSETDSRRAKQNCSASGIPPPHSISSRAGVLDKIREHTSCLAVSIQRRM